MTGDAGLRASVVPALGGKGYKVLAAETFVEGRRLLIDWQPDVLVTSVRLQEHNGLHLAIVSRMSSILTKTIVIGYADLVLQGEARQAGAQYLTSPRPEDVVAAVETAIQRHERRWPRTRVNIPARAAEQTVRLVDFSYGGFRIELAPGTALPSTEGFDLTVGGVRVTAAPVWMKQQADNERIWCGATVAGNGESNAVWREFVDGALGQQSVGQ